MRFLLCALALLPTILRAQGNLAGYDWRLRRGDDPSWATTPFTEAGTPINLGVSLDRQNQPYDNLWLRTDVVVPAAYRESGVTLTAAFAARRWEVFVNGQCVLAPGEGQETGSAELPTELLHSDRPNQIAVRLLSRAWTGGLDKNQLRIVPRRSAGPELALRYALTAPDHIVASDAPAAFDTTTTLAPNSPAPVRLHVRVTDSFHRVVHASRRTLDGDTRTVPQRWELGRLPPEFYQVVVQAEQGGFHAQQVFWFGVDPTKIDCVVQPEKDASAFWERAIGELAAVPPNFRVTRVPEKSTARHEVYSVEMDSVEGVTVRGWYVVPTKQSRPMPALLHVPGYSVGFQPEDFCTDDDLIQLALEIRGHGRSTDILNPGFQMPGYVGHRVLEPEHYIYKGAYLDCGRALGFLASRPEVDARRIGVTGGSQGGGLSFASAALYPDRVSACAAGMPFLGDFAHHIRIRDIYREEMEMYRKSGDPKSWATILRSMNLIDTVCLVGRIRCPVLMGHGLFDDDCPPHIGFAVYNRIAAPKSYRVYPEEGHLLGRPWALESHAWLRRQLGLPAKSAK